MRENNSKFDGEVGLDRIITKKGMNAKDVCLVSTEKTSKNVEIIKTVNLHTHVRLAQLLAIVLTLALCMTGCMQGPLLESARQLVNVYYPEEEIEHIFEVPREWTDAMQEIDGEKQFTVPNGKIDAGYVFAGTKIVTKNTITDINVAEKTVLDFLKNEAKNKSQEKVDIEINTHEVFQDYKTTNYYYTSTFDIGDKSLCYSFCMRQPRSTPNNIKAYTADGRAIQTTENTNANENANDSMTLDTAEKSSDDQDSQKSEDKKIEIYCFWADTSYAGQIEMLNIARSLRKIETIDDRGMISIRSSFEDVVDTRTPEEKKNDLREDACTLLDSYLSTYKQLDTAIELAISGYSILTLEEMEFGQYGTSTENEQTLRKFSSMYRWDLIYPNLHIFVVDFETKPVLKKYTNVIVPCENARVEEDGTTRFEKAYMVVASDVYLAEVGRPMELCLVGFLKDVEDEAVLDLANTWYDENIYPKVAKKYSTAYIGNHVLTGNLVKGLPLIEKIDFSGGTFTDKSIVLKTANEPFGLEISYHFDDPLFNFNALLSSNLLTDQDYINASVRKAIDENAHRLFECIGNLDHLTIKVYFLDGGDKVSQKENLVIFEYTRGVTGSSESIAQF